MAVNKNFVVKNGLEVAADALVVSSENKNVGVGTTVGQVLLDVRGAIGATHLNVSGVGTIVTLNSTNFTGTAGTITTFTSTNGTITNLTSTAATITTLTGTSASITNFTPTNINVSGVSTLGVSTINQVYVSGVSTFVGVATFQGDLYVGGDLYVADDLLFDEFTARNINVTGVATIATLDATTGTIDYFNSTNINSSGITTLGIANVTNLTGTAGTFTTFTSTDATITNSTITNLTGTAATITNGTVTNLTGTAATITTLTSTDGTIGNVQISSGIITASSGIVTYYGDGQFLSNVISGVGIRTEGSIIGYGVTLIDFRGAGISTITSDSATGIGTINIVGGGGGASISIGTVFSGIATNGNLWYKSDLGRLFIYYQDEDSAQWVDASPFNIGIITSLTNVSYNAGSAISPSIYFNTDPQTGWFSPGLGKQTFVSAGSSILNVNPSGVNVTGVVTATSFVGDGSNLSGIDATALKDSGGSVIVQANSSGIVVTGVVTATSFVGDGSGLTGAGSTVADDTTTNESFFPLFTQSTSGTVTATKVSSTKFTFNPSTGEAAATNFNSTSDEILKTNIHTIENSLNIVDNLRGVSFDWKENGKGSYGVIAQELEQVLPELVTQTDPKSVNYNGIIGVLIEAVKELKKEIDELKKS